MKSHLRYFLRAGILLGAVHLSMAQDETVNGNLFATGNLDINGNTASFGTSGANPGYSLVYTNGNPATIDFTASAAGANWMWSQGISNPQLRLTSSNILSLYSPGNTVAKLTFDPAGSILIKGPGSDDFMIQNLSVGNSGEVRLIVGDNALETGETDRLSIGAANYAVAGSWYPRLTVMSAGNVGIGTTTPTAKLDVAGDVKVTGTLTTTGTVTAPSVTLPDGSTLTSARTTTLYDASGQAVATVSSGGKVKFTNGFSVGTGISTSTGAIAMGNGTTASGVFATAMGDETTASGYTATATGIYATASGTAATAMGYSTIASGTAATAMGSFTTASGYSATAMGDSTTAHGYAATAMGFLNVTREVENPLDPQPTDDLLVIGNGYFDFDWWPSNAFAVHRNGNVRAAGDLEVRGVIRIKATGDLSMGTFTASPVPNHNPAMLNPGLRYNDE